MGSSPNCVLTSFDGSVWAFGESNCPLRLASTPTGLGGSPDEFDDVEGVAIDGVVFVAMTRKPNMITCDVRFGPDFEGSPISGDTAVAMYRDYRAALGNGRQVSRFEITETGRFQMVRAVMSTMPDANYSDAYNVGFVPELIQFRSDESWWRKDPFDETFDYGDTITVANHGDVDSWPWVQITGPITGPTFGLAGESIMLEDGDGDPLVLPAGKTLTINTDPDYWGIVDSDGVDHSWIGGRWHQKAPAGDGAIPVTFTGSATTSATKIRIVVPQLYFRAI